MTLPGQNTSHPTNSSAEDSRIKINDVLRFNSVIVVVDIGRTRDIKLGQLADYIAMVGLARIHLDAEFDGEPTILRIFTPSAADRRNGPIEHHCLDLDFLKALYSTSQLIIISARQSRTECCATSRIKILWAGLLVDTKMTSNEHSNYSADRSPSCRLVAAAWLTRPVEKSSATVWLSGRGSECMVTTLKSQQKWMPCADVPRHLRGTLHLLSGAGNRYSGATERPQGVRRVHERTVETVGLHGLWGQFPVT